MQQTKSFDPEKITIHEYKLVKGQIDTPETFIPEDAPDFNVETSFKLAFNLGEKLVKADFTIDIKAESKGANSSQASGNFHLVFIFSVDNLDDLAIPDKDNVLDLNPELGNTLASITYSTSRGILLTRLQGTALQRFMLPVINPNKLLP